MMLLRMAYMTSSAREWKSSLSMMLARWASAGLTLMLRRLATSLLDLPSARSWRISRSRGVRREREDLALSEAAEGTAASETRGEKNGLGGLRAWAASRKGWGALALVV